MIVALLLAITHISSLSSEFILQEYSQKLSNDLCKLTVSLSGAGQYKTIADALSYPCTDIEGYEVTLIDAQHVEHLEVNQNSTIVIKSGNSTQTIWQLESFFDQTLNLIQGNLTLQNIEFHYNTIDDPKPTIVPNSYIIYAGRQGYSTSLFVNQCTFQSVSGDNGDAMIHIVTIDSSVVEINNCVFSGLSTYQPSSISMVFADNCSSVKLINSKFVDAFIISTQSAVELQTKAENASVVVENCEFHNLISNGYPLLAALKVRGDIKFKATITKNKFTSCSATDSYSGALYLVDSSNGDISSEFTVTYNTFDGNSGNNTGSIFLNSLNSNSLYNFSNNSFSHSKNNRSDSIGQDAYLLFNDFPDNWTVNATSEMIINWFSGSSTDAGNKSVYFEAFRDEKIYMSGNVSLSLAPSKKGKLSKAQMIWIIVGSVALIAVISVTVVIVVVVLCKKRKYSKPEQLKESLLAGEKQNSE